jgi:adenylate kinase
VAAGELVSDDLVETVVHRHLSEHDWNYGFIIDGFPRNQPQARFYLIFHRPATAGVCDVCGGQLVARADDTPEAIQGRLRDYHDKTRPVLELFRAKEVVVAVDATGPVEQVQAAIREQLGVEIADRNNGFTKADTPAAPPLKPRVPDLDHDVLGHVIPRPEEREHRVRRIVLERVLPFVPHLHEHSASRGPARASGDQRSTSDRSRVLDQLTTASPGIASGGGAACAPAAA